MKVHRLITLLLMTLLALVALGIGVLAIPSNPTGPSLIALAIVLIAATITGVAMSWRRYRVSPSAQPLPSSPSDRSSSDASQ